MKTVIINSLYHIIIVLSWYLIIGDSKIPNEFIFLGFCIYLILNEIIKKVNKH